MNEIIIDAYGKINLALDVVSRRDDGYHEINSVMQSISLKDTLTIENLDTDEIVIECNKDCIPLNSENLVYKSWAKMKEVSGVDRGIKVYIEKNIPIGAGLAGGSSNAAAVLVAINELWDLGYTKGQLREIGVSIGADVPFTVEGGTALAGGIGEKLEILESFKDKHVLICNPGIEISSKYAYDILEIEEDRVNMEEVLKGIENKDTYHIRKFAENKMEKAIFVEYPIIKKIKDDLINLGSSLALMSGSGSTVFGIFEDEDMLEKASKYLKTYVDVVEKTKTI